VWKTVVFLTCSSHGLIGLHVTRELVNLLGVMENRAGWRVSQRRERAAFFHAYDGRDAATKHVGGVGTPIAEARIDVIRLFALARSASKFFFGEQSDAWFLHFGSPGVCAGETLKIKKPFRRLVKR
jgi:hypothetical protein